MARRRCWRPCRTGQVAHSAATFSVNADQAITLAQQLKSIVQQWDREVGRFKLGRL